MKLWVPVVCILLILVAIGGVKIWTDAIASTKFVNRGLQEVSIGLAEATNGLRNPYFGRGNGIEALDADGAAKSGIGHAAGAWNTMESTLVQNGLSIQDAIDIELILMQLQTYVPPSPIGYIIPTSTRQRIYNWDNLFVQDLNVRNETPLQSLKQRASKLISMYKGYKSDQILSPIIPFLY